MAMDMMQRLARGIGFGKAASTSRWRTPATLDRGLLGEACLALDGQGLGSALWENAGNLWTLPIGPRSSPAIVRLPLGEGRTPKMLMNPNGHGVILWQAGIPGDRQILGKILDGGDALEHVIFRTEGQIHHLQAAVDRRGNALVVWLLEREGVFEVMAQSFDTRGRTWDQEPTVLSVPSSRALEPRIAANHREHAMVVWEAEGTLGEGLVASHYWPLDHIWSDRPVPVVSHAARHHQVVMDDAGNALALWVHAPYGRRSTLEASFYDAHRSEWSEPEALASAQTFTSPRLAMAGNGEALAAWCQGEGHGASRFFSKTFMNGKWEPGTDCLELGQGPVHDFAIALGPDHQAGLIAAHRGPEGDWVSARLKQREWSAPTQLSAATPAPCSAPQIVFCAQGASALWFHGQGREKALMLAETR
jgi:hypothetical protein